METPREEVIVAQFRRSMWTHGFWWRTILTLGLYVILLWRRNVITVTNRRVIQRTGNIIGGQEVSMQLNRITDVTVRTGAFGSLLGFGLIEIQSSGSGKAEIHFEGISRPHKLKDIIFDLQDGVIDGSPFRQNEEGDVEKAKNS